MKVKLLFLFLMLLAACNTANKPMTEEQKASVQDEGSVVVNDFINALKTSDVEKLLSLITNSRDYAYIVAGEVYTYDQQVDMASQYLQYIESQTFITKFEKYIILDPSCFTYIWKGDNGMYMKTGDSTILKDYLMALTFRKNEGSWKLMFGHESESTPLPIDTTMVQ
jgi:uncharacterized protein YcfL